MDAPPPRRAISTPRRVVDDRLLPVPAVEVRGANVVQAHAVETTHVDVDLVRIRARHVEGVNPAMTAKVMFGDAGIELVSRELFAAPQELEAVAWNDQMKNSLLRADRAVALAHAVERRGHAEADAPAVAAALVGGHSSP